MVEAGDGASGVVQMASGRTYISTCSVRVCPELERSGAGCGGWPRTAVRACTGQARSGNERQTRGQKVLDLCGARGRVAVEDQRWPQGRTRGCARGASPQLAWRWLGPGGFFPLNSRLCATSDEAQRDHVCIALLLVCAWQVGSVAGGRRGDGLGCGAHSRAHYATRRIGSVSSRVRE